MTSYKLNFAQCLRLQECALFYSHIAFCRAYQAYARDHVYLPCASIRYRDVLNDVEPIASVEVSDSGDATLTAFDYTFEIGWYGSAVRRFGQNIMRYVMEGKPPLSDGRTVFVVTQLEMSKCGNYDEPMPIIIASRPGISDKDAYIRAWLEDNFAGSGYGSVVSFTWHHDVC